jgi:WD40 repeat protein
VTRLLPQSLPLIAYERRDASEKRLVILNPSDGTSKEFRFPAGAIFATPFLAGLSPDGRYFVYYEGARLEIYDQLIAEPSDFVMRVLDLESQEVIFSTLLLSPEFPQNLKPIVEMTVDQYWMDEPDQQAMLDNMYYTMRRTMLEKIRSIAWSPDGSLLAYPSQDPGPTSDMYYFDPAQGKSWRASSEPRHVFALTWAPDSAAIVLETTLYQTQGTHITTDVVDRLGEIIRTVENKGYFREWFAPDLMLFSRFTDSGDSYFELVLISANTGEQTMLWEGSFADLAIAPDLSSYMLTSSQPSSDQSPGLYLVLTGIEAPLHLSESVGWNVSYVGAEPFSYTASAPTTGIFGDPQTGGSYSVSLTGELSLFDEGTHYFLPSPDARFLAAYGPYEKIAGLTMFTGKGKPLITLSSSVIRCLNWDPASDILAYQDGKSLYLWQEGDESGRQLATQLEDELDYQECAFTWINPPP